MSITELTQVTVTFIENNQVWAIPIMFLLAFGESLAVLSLLLPATAMLLGAGALIGAGLLPFWPTWITVTIGAILGDSVSYWLGKYYHQQVISSWPLKNHQKLIYRAEQFFHRYGVMGVFIGRFFGPLRAFVPLVAGTMQMPSIKFNLANVTSALVWAFGMLLPGTLGVQWLADLMG